VAALRGSQGKVFEGQLKLKIESGLAAAPHWNCGSLAVAGPGSGSEIVAASAFQFSIFNSIQL
jgi:hypothetical protein